tara:strand:- start:239 stop:847 length:609 start_codon:yes stop_codon:yes gene_type:complete
MIKMLKLLSTFLLTMISTTTALNLNLRRTSVAPPSLPNPEDKAHEPVVGYPTSGAPNWWSKLYLPLDSGGTSKVPMPDGLMIAQSESLRTSHKAIPWDNAETLVESPDTDNAGAEAGSENLFKPGTDAEYLEARQQGTTSSVKLDEDEEKNGENGEEDQFDAAKGLVEEVTPEEAQEDKALSLTPKQLEAHELESNPNAYKR